jgi:hypothetical protein
MALDYKIDEEKLKALPEAVQKEYELKDGFYFLQASGMVQKERLNEFRDNNIKLVKQNDDYKTHIDGLGNLTAADIAELKKKAEAGGGNLDEEQLKALVEEETKKRVKKMQDEHTTALTAEQEGRATSDKMLSKLIIDTNVQAESVKSGVRDTAIEDVLLRARNVFRVENGKAVPYKMGEKGEEIVYGKDGQTPQTINEWLADQVETAPHLFKESKGSGAHQQQDHSSGASNDSKATGINRMNNAHSST